MKFGLRRPSPLRSLTARTTGRLTRRVKASVNPFYGKKGVGLLRNPRRAARGAVYRRTTFGLGDVLKLFRR